MRTSPLAAAAAAALLIVGFGIVHASPTSADEVWHQGVGRPTADAPCPQNTSQETASGWSEWAPSYALWAHDGRGGWVCERHVTWARDAVTPPFPGCQSAPPYYLNFGNRYYVGSGSPGYLDSLCTQLAPQTLPNDVVYATDTSQAESRCLQDFGWGGSVTQDGTNAVIWTCGTN